VNAASISKGTQQRKQQSDQLDRLDSILDALSEGLNGAVADAAREGTRLAVKDAIIEIMTDPTLRSRLHEATAPEPAPALKTGLWAWVKARTGQAVAAVSGAASKLLDGAARSGQRLAGVAARGVRALQGWGRWKNLALVGLGAGVAVGLASLLAPHAVAAAVSGLSGAVAATAIHFRVWTRRTARALSLV
jgi:hypothetical protein